jgi:hypothetical protein
MAVRSNDPPDVELRLTHAQATFLLNNCDANIRLGFAIVMSIADEKITQEEKMAKAEKYEELRKQFLAIQKLLRDAGAREKEE